VPSEQNIKKSVIRAIKGMDFFLEIDASAEIPRTLYKSIAQSGFDRNG